MKTFNLIMFKQKANIICENYHLKTIISLKNVKRIVEWFLRYASAIFIQIVYLKSALL